MKDGTGRRNKERRNKGNRGLGEKKRRKVRKAKDKMRYAERKENE